MAVFIYLFIYLFHSFTTTKEIENDTAEELAELRISVVEGLLHTDM